MNVISIIQIVALWVVGVTVAILVLRKLLYGGLADAMSRLKQREQEQAARARQLQERLARIEAESTKRRRQIQAEALRIQREGQRAAAELKQMAVQESKSLAQQLLRDAEQQREHLTRELEMDIDRRATASAAVLIQRVLTPRQREQLHRVCMEELFDELERGQWTAPPGSNGQVEVASAAPLQPEQAKRLKQAPRGTGQPIRGVRPSMQNLLWRRPAKLSELPTMPAYRDS